MSGWSDASRRVAVAALAVGAGLAGCASSTEGTARAPEGGPGAESRATEESRDDGAEAEGAEEGGGPDGRICRAALAYLSRLAGPRSDDVPEECDRVELQSVGVSDDGGLRRYRVRLWLDEENWRAEPLEFVAVVESSGEVGVSDLRRQVERRTDRPHRRATRLRMQTIRTALTRYYAANNRVPNSLDALVREGLLPEIPTDGWNHAFDYRKTGSKTYELISPGSDGRPGTADDVRIEGP